MISIIDLQNALGNMQGKIIHKKFRNKKNNAKKRGLDFDLHNEDAILLSDKLSGKGVCDYTGLPFCMRTPGSGMYPSLERIDDRVGYVRGNVCVVGARPNQLKDIFYDKTNKYSHGLGLSSADIEFMRYMTRVMTQDHMEGLTKKYIPTTRINLKGELNMLPQEDPRGEYAKQISKDILGLPEPVAVADLPIDVEIAAGYAEMCKFLYKNKREVTITFAQFKVAYTAKKCIITGKDLDEDKIPFILDNNAPVEAGNVKFVDSGAGEHMNNLLSATGMSFSDLAKNLRKFA